mgnify:CR=1 FL=1
MSNFTQVRAGTTNAVDFQCILDGAPAQLGTPSSVVLKRIRTSDNTTLSDITLTVQDAVLGKVRWIPTSGHCVLSEGGYLCSVVVTGGTNPGTYPTQEYVYIGVLFA